MIISHSDHWVEHSVFAKIFVINGMNFHAVFDTFSDGIDVYVKNECDQEFKRVTVIPKSADIINLKYAEELVKDAFRNNVILKYLVRCKEAPK